MHWKFRSWQLQFFLQNLWDLGLTHGFVEKSDKKKNENRSMNALWHPLSPYKKDKDKRESKGRHCCLGTLEDILECRTNHLAARMNWTKIFRITFILAGWWFGMVWIWWSSIFLIHPFCQVAVILFIIFFKSSWWEISIAARN